VVLATKEPAYEKTLGNMEEVRGAAGTCVNGWFKFGLKLSFNP
jgi:hypothetical protein